MKNQRIYLSPPNVGIEEATSLSQVVSEGWISSVGSFIDLFETNLEKIYPNRRVLALNSGTSALHLSVILAGIGKGDTVGVSTLTFAASVNVILYQDAIPVFIDSELDTWNLDPDLLREYLHNTDRKPKAIIVTHLYGVPARIDEIKQVCEENSVILIEDAAEAVGSTFQQEALGSFGDFGILSFNGNKIITTSGGGALICNNRNYERGLHLSTQANSGRLDYYHKEIGYNYRMSNVLAGIGVAQLNKLKDFVSTKRSTFEYYKKHLSEWFEFPDEPDNSFCNRWLTTPIAKEGFDIEKLMAHLDSINIESRRLWRPMHLQPIYKQFKSLGGAVSEGLYRKGICLPSGTGLTKKQIDKVIHEIRSFIS